MCSVTRDGLENIPSRVVIIDGNNLTHRVFHAVPHDGAVTPDGKLVNAVIGWVRSIRSIRRSTDAPMILPVFDGEGKNWRCDAYPAYKKNRPPHSADLTDQWSVIFEIVKAMGMDVLQVDGVEGDDLIASYTWGLTELGTTVEIVSNDKDLNQLVRDTPDVRTSYRRRGELVLTGPREVRSRYGVEPRDLRKLLALAGDRSDGIPGISGIGNKRAAALINSGGWGAALATYEDLPIFYEIVGLRRVALPIELKDLRMTRPSSADMDEVFRRAGFSDGWEALVSRHP